MLSCPRFAGWQPQSLVRAVSILALGASPWSDGRLCHGLRGDHAFPHSCVHLHGASLRSCEILRDAFHRSYGNLRVFCRHSCENRVSPRFLLSGADPRGAFLPSSVTHCGDVPFLKSVSRDWNYFRFCSLKFSRSALALLGHQYLFLGGISAAHHFLIRAPQPQPFLTQWQVRLPLAR